MKTWHCPACGKDTKKRGQLCNACDLRYRNTYFSDFLFYRGKERNKKDGRDTRKAS